MSKLNYFFLVFLVVACGCGGSSYEAHPDQPSDRVAESKLSDSAAQRFGLHLMYGDVEPKTKMSEFYPQDFSADQNEFVIHRKLFLNDPLSPNVSHRQELFLVWPEDSLGSRLRTVFYTHRVQKSGAKELLDGTLEPKPAWHDAENHRWFIPLVELFRENEGYGLADVKLSDIQRLNLELSFEEGPNVHLQVRFQVSGALLSTEAVSVELLAPDSWLEWIKKGAKEGITLKKEKFVNTQRRPYSIWIQIQKNTSPLVMTTYLQESHFISQAAAPPSGPHWNPFQAQGKFEVDHVEVQHRGPGKSIKVESLSLSQGQWGKVTLQPMETLELEWKARVRVGVETCHLPASQSVQLYWQTPEVHTFTWIPSFEELDRLARNPFAIDIYNLRMRGLILFPIRPGEDREQYMSRYSIRVPNPVIPAQLHSQPCIREWRLKGGSLVGEWEPEIRLSHDFASSVDESILLEKGKFPVSFQYGEVAPSAPLYTCQGVFP